MQLKPIREYYFLFVGSGVRFCIHALQTTLKPEHKTQKKVNQVFMLAKVTGMILCR